MWAEKVAAARLSRVEDAGTCRLFSSARWPSWNRWWQDDQKEEPMTKRLVACCDGTWNTPQEKCGGVLCPTNVAKLKPAIPCHDRQGMEQKPFYNEGVGTGRVDHWLGGVFGWGISKHIRAVYSFLVKEYEPGDEIFLFGFSRGAYTARSVAGLVRNCGILKPYYIDVDAARPWQARGFHDAALPTAHPHDPQHRRDTTVRAGLEPGAAPQRGVAHGERLHSPVLAVQPGGLPEPPA
jgi:hypothetical protein